MPRTCRSWRSKRALPGGVPGLRWSVISLVVSKNPPQRLKPLEMVTVDRSTEALREPKAKAPSNFLRLEAVPFPNRFVKRSFDGSWRSLRMDMVLGLQDFVGIRVVGRQQRQQRQVAEKIPKPYSTDGNGNDHIGNGHGQSLGKIWFDDPKQIEEAHQQQPGREPHQAANVPLEGAREKHGERDGEGEQHQKQLNRFPAAMQARQIKSNLGGQVASPNDEPLRKVEIGPDHGENQHPLAVVVDEIRGQYLRHRLVIEQD